MLDRRDDFPTASSMGFGATTTTTRSLGVSGLEANDDDEVELVSETQKTEKDPTKITRKCVCIYIYIYVYIFIQTFCFCAFDIFSVWLQGNLRKINVERVPPFKP